LTTAISAEWCDRRITGIGSRENGRKESGNNLDVIKESNLSFKR
jgi:hypothetical protein